MCKFKFLNVNLQFSHAFHYSQFSSMHRVVLLNMTALPTAPILTLQKVHNMKLTHLHKGRTGATVS